MNPHIIGINGNMGSGKSTLAKTLSHNLTATLIAWDDFDDLSNGPNDYVDWYNTGSDYREWNYPILAIILQQVKSRKKIIHPVLKVDLKPTAYIIFHPPLGRLHKQKGKYIDTWVHIEVPRDVSLCRWLIRDFKTSGKKNDLIQEIELYLSTSRPLFFDDEMKLNADFVFDGMLSTDQQYESTKHYLNEKC